MTDLIDFLRARLDDDEQIAQRASAYYPTWTYNRENFTVSSSGWSIAARKDDGSPINDVDGEHIARHDPARLLREVDAKRRILDEHPRDPALAECLTCRVDDSTLRQEWPCVTLLFLALPYADHADYDESWRP